MSNIEIQKISIVDLDTDCIVNAANDGLWAGSGVCGAIFQAAGYAQLQQACNAIGHCDVGSAVITPGFQLKAKYIIHAVGPRWDGGQQGEKKLLYSAYQSALKLAKENGCHSIGFPLISSGIFGVPKDIAWRKALQACSDFLNKHKDHEMKIIFAVLNEGVHHAGMEEMQKHWPVNTAKGESVPDSDQNHVRAESLIINGQPFPAIFFHKPEEPYGFLSNWYPSNFTLEGRTFSSAEQYIMYRKCMLFADIESANAVLATDSPAEQQKIARTTEYNNTVWNGLRQMVARTALYAKFSQNGELKAALLATEDAWLVECAWSDRIWACGVGLNSAEKYNISSWKGRNILGFALMDVRKDLSALS